MRFRPNSSNANASFPLDDEPNLPVLAKEAATIVSGAMVMINEVYNPIATSSKPNETDVVLLSHIIDQLDLFIQTHQLLQYQLKDQAIQTICAFHQTLEGDLKNPDFFQKGNPTLHGRFQLGSQVCSQAKIDQPQWVDPIQPPHQGPYTKNVAVQQIGVVLENLLNYSSPITSSWSIDLSTLALSFQALVHATEAWGFSESSFSLLQTKLASLDTTLVTMISFLQESSSGYEKNYMEKGSNSDSFKNQQLTLMLNSLKNGPFFQFICKSMKSSDYAALLVDNLSTNYQVFDPLFASKNPQAFFNNLEDELHSVNCIWQKLVQLIGMTYKPTEDWLSHVKTMLKTDPQTQIFTQQLGKSHQNLGLLVTRNLASMLNWRFTLNQKNPGSGDHLINLINRIVWNTHCMTHALTSPATDYFFPNSEQTFWVLVEDSYIAGGKNPPAPSFEDFENNKSQIEKDIGVLSAS